MSTKSKSSSFDPIPPSNFKQSLTVLLSPITTLLQTGIFPRTWKCRFVTLLLKKPVLERVPFNYRSVTNLPFFVQGSGPRNGCMTLFNSFVK